MQRLGFLEWHMISAKNLYCFFELRFGVVVFRFRRRDDRLRPRHFAGQPAPVLSISEYLAAAGEVRVRFLRVARFSMYSGKERSRSRSSSWNVPFRFLDRDLSQSLGFLEITKLPSNPGKKRRLLIAASGSPRQFEFSWLQIVRPVRIRPSQDARWRPSQTTSPILPKRASPAPDLRSQRMPQAITVTMSAEGRWRSSLGLASSRSIHN